MKRQLLIALLILCMGVVSLSGNSLALAADQGSNRNDDLIEIEIGDGTQTNTMSGAPTPYGTYYKSFRQQYLIKASELITLGAGTGNIQSIAFQVSSVNNCSAMPNYRIRLKHTLQNALIATFETGNYQEVFQANSFLPEVGWNQHSFATPFHWDGTSNLIVDIVADIIPGNHTQNASVYYTNAGFNSSVRFHSDTTPGANATSGTVSQNRSNMKLVMQELNVRDLAATQIVGDAIIIANSTGNFTITVKSLSSLPMSNYFVRLYSSDGTELATVTGGVILPFEEIQYNLNWTPANSGIYQVYGRAVLADDDYPDNNNTQMMTVHVVEQGYASVQIGHGVDITEPLTDSTSPYGTYYNSFRQQYLFTATELSANQASAGTINYIAFKVQDLGACTPMHNYRINLKTTTRTDLSQTYFEEGEYLNVFQADTYMPTLGMNIHAFHAPFAWDGASNIIVEIITDFVEGNNSGNAFSYYTPTSFISCLRAQSQAGNAPAPTRTSAKRPNTLFFFNTQPMGSLSGNVSEEGFAVPNVEVRLHGSIYHAISDINGDYLIEAIPAGTHIIDASKAGYESISHSVNIAQGTTTTQDFELTGMPEYHQDRDFIAFGDVITGGHVYKKVVVTNIGGGELSLNSMAITGNPAFSISSMPSLPARLRTEDSVEIEILYMPTSIGNMSATLNIQDNRGVRDAHSVEISGIGVPNSALTLGEGNEVANVPLDFFYNQSIFETVITAEEMQYFNGTIRGLKFYYVFQSDGIMEKHHKIWLGTTTETGLSNGWIRPNNLTLVFDGNLTYPAGEHTIEMIFDQPFEYTNGENLVMLFYRDNDTQTFTLFERFRTQTWGTDRSLYVVSWWEFTDNIDPMSVEFNARHLSGSFPKTTFLLEAEDLGHHTISGTFSTESWDLEDIQIAASGIALQDISYDPDSGQYSVIAPHGWSGSIVPSKEGYVIEPASRDFTNLNLSFENQNFVVKKDIDPSEIAILYPENGAVFDWEEPQSITITWQSGDIAPEHYEINFDDGGWESVGLATGYTTEPLASGEYTFLVRGVIDTPQAKMALSKASGAPKGASEISSVSFTVNVDVSNADLVQPSITQLMNNYPNPFNPETTISYSLAEHSQVKLQIYNLKGQLVNTLVDRSQAAGNHSIVFDARDRKGNRLSSGIYLYRLKTDNFTQTKKMILME